MEVINDEFRNTNALTAKHTQKVLDAVSALSETMGKIERHQLTASSLPDVLRSAADALQQHHPSSPVNLAPTLPQSLHTTPTQEKSSRQPGPGAPVFRTSFHSPSAIVEYWNVHGLSHHGSMKNFQTLEPFVPPPPLQQIDL